MKNTYLSIKEIQEIVSNDLQEVNNIIIDNIGNEVPLIKDLSKHILASGGKRIRPIVTLLSSSICNYSGKNHLFLAACVEFIHTATLLHDDVIDESKVRRGVATANDVFGNKTSILVGDFLFSRAFELMVQNGSKKILEILSKASSTIAQGEVLQLTTINDSTTSKELYMKIIKNKTASLFSAASEIGAILSEEEYTIQKSLKVYGEKLGTAFQLVDDALDYVGTSALDKNIGDDFREGKMTLPVIISLEASNLEEKSFWIKTIENLDQSSNDLNKAIELINKYNGISSTLALAKKYSMEAIKSLEIFPQSEAKLALESLASIAVNRKK
ncbi:polyprenyl synthetase family protein [Alphaproteobacteria bacterium]|nr:polyprenyl synthetase family protein [Alphaproteobacteria bacterium]